MSLQGLHISHLLSLSTVLYLWYLCIFRKNNNNTGKCPSGTLFNELSLPLLAVTQSHTTNIALYFYVFCMHFHFFPFWNFGGKIFPILNNMFKKTSRFPTLLLIKTRGLSIFEAWRMQLRNLNLSIYRCVCKIKSDPVTILNTSQ